MAGMPTEGVFQLDGQGTLTDIHVAYGAITVPARWADFRLFGLRYEDRRPIAKVDNRPAAIRAGDLSAVKVNTIGANLTLAHPIGSAKGDLLLWGALQNGDWGAESHLANAFAAEAGAPAGAAARAMAARGHLSRKRRRYAGNDGERSALDLLPDAPDPRIYARTPFYNMMNNRDLFGSLILRPARATSVRTEVHSLSLTESKDLWYAGGGAYSKTVFGYQGRPSGGKSGLATLADIGADRGFGPVTSLGAYVGKVFGRDVVKSLHPAGSDGAFFYLEMTRRF